MSGPQYAPGDLVRVVASTYVAFFATRAMIGNICKVKRSYPGDAVSVWNVDGTASYLFNPSDLEPATPPDEIEQHGVTYVRKDRVEQNAARFVWLMRRRLIYYGVPGFAVQSGRTPEQYAIDLCAAIDAAMRAEQETGHD